LAVNKGFIASSFELAGNARFDATQRQENEARFASPVLAAAKKEEV
jgi:hypothetical protein